MDIQLPQIIFQIINFSVVLGAITYLLYKPVLKILDDRSKKIAQSQRAAEETISERNKLAELEKEIKEKADKKAAEILESARKNAKKIEQEQVEKTSEQAKKEISKQKESWEAEKEQHLSDMKKEFVTSVVAAAEKVVGEQIDAKKHQKIIDAELSNLLKTI